jgi:hypothetical protein
MLLNLASLVSMLNIDMMFQPQELLLSKTQEVTVQKEKCFFGLKTSFGSLFVDLALAAFFAEALSCETALA